MSQIHNRVMNGLKSYWIWILVLFIFPFVVCSLFIHPQVDDYLFTEVTRANGFTKTQSLFYNYWLARYFSTALLCSLNPLLIKSLILYRTIPLVLIIILGLSIGFFIRTIFNRQLSHWQTLSIITTILALFFMKMPSAAEGLFWMTGSYTYTFALAASIYLLAWIVQLLTRKNGDPNNQAVLFTCLKGALLAVMIAGFNEISMISMIVLIAMIMAYRLIFLKSFDIPIFFILLIFSVAFIVVIKSPGVSFRAQLTVDVSQSQKLLVSMKQSLSYTFRFYFQWTPILIAASLFFFDTGIRKMQDLKENSLHLFNVNPLLSFFLGPLLIFIGLFPGFWAQGFILPQRALNVIFFHFLLAWSYFILTLIYYLYKRHRAKPGLIPKWAYAISMGGLIFFIVSPNNLRTTYKDLISGKMLRYDREETLRSSSIFNCADSACVVVGLKYKPKTIFYADFFGDPFNMLNFSYASYYNKQAIIVDGREKNPPEPKYEKFKWKIPIVR